MANKKPTFSIATLGCRANQADSDRLRAILVSAGFEESPFGRPVDCAVVNTCTVTAEADRKSRQMLRRALRVIPDGAQAIATGCAVAERGGLKSLPKAALRLPPDRREDILSLLNVEACPGREPETAVSTKTRALLKVQDGCDQFCTFCIVPYVRGRSSSVSIEEAVRRAVEFEKEGYQELVLTGIHLSIWGHDLEGKPDLADLVAAILKATDQVQIRISSVEPDRFPLRLIDLMESDSRLCPFLHLVLQHASDKLLDRMHRGYNLAVYEQIVQRFFSRVPTATLSSDIMIGFPGETDQDHKTLMEFLRRTPYYHLHVFPYSVRPGTAASKFSDQVKPETKKERRDQVLRLASKLKVRSLRSMKGRRITAIFEKEFKPGWYKGTTLNGMSVVAKAGPAVLSKRVPVRITRRLGSDLVAMVERCRS
jgi:threonylcarbamoyladenosine tRNA methylthiotransferase MtaB